MILSILFSAYLAGVAGVAVTVLALTLSRRAGRWAIATLALWLTFATALGAIGVAGRTDIVPPGIALLSVPAMSLVLLTTLTGPGAVLARDIPLRVLIGFQLFRFGVELTLHRLAGLGLAPRMMTLEGGNIEILVAATAPIAAWLVSRGAAGRTFALAWNLVGLLSLANIVTRAVLSAPGPLQLLHAEVPDMAILTFPFTFIPGFMAPLALALHILAFRAFVSTRTPAR